jgi:beta-glucosidase
VFLSGRPLWVNPELNASDAFVAAWLPGSEGGGIADVLVAGADGKPRHDFSGKLPFSWPRTAAQLELNKGQPDYEPLFALGHGLDYGSTTTLPVLPEVSGVNAATTNAGNYYRRGRTSPPWRLALREDGKATVIEGNRAASVSGALSLEAIDANGLQEGGRRLRWNGSRDAEVAIIGSADAGPLDLQRQANADMVLQLQYRVDAAPQGPVTVAMGCTDAGNAPCRGTVDVTALLKGAPTGQWRTAKIRLTCFRKAGTDMARVAEPFVLGTAAALDLSIAEVRLVADPTDAVCPGQ